MLNNAECSLVSTAEEVSEEKVRACFDTNRLGTLWVVQDVLPFLCRQSRRHIASVSSSLGHINFPLIGTHLPPSGPSRRCIRAWCRRSEALAWEAQDADASAAQSGSQKNA